MRWSRFILLVLLSVALPGRAHDGNGGDDDPPKEHPQPPGHKPGQDGKKRQERSQNGTYNVELRGYYTGTGSAVVAESSISITVKVTLANGATTEFIAKNIKVDGPYFSGRAQVNDETIQISGRLDAARSSRLVGSYRGVSGHVGRFVGTLPTDTGDDKWNE